MDEMTIQNLARKWTEESQKEADLQAQQEQPEQPQTNESQLSENDGTNDAATTAPQIPQQQESNVERNMRALRQKAERAERERDEYQRRLAEYEALQAKAQQHQNDDDEDLRINPDELAEGKHLAKVAKKIQRLEQQIKSYQQQSSVSTIETRLRTEHPDFDRIMTRDNIEALAAADPELAATINANPDLYTKAVTAYRQIKRLGIVSDPAIEYDKQRIAQNSMKPKPVASVSPQKGDSPLSRANAFANGLTDDLKKQLWKEMQDARRGY